MNIELKILDKELYNIPSFATDKSCAMDLMSAEDITLYPGDIKRIRTGIAIHIGSYCKTCNNRKKTHGVAALILPRSGLGSRGLVLANTIGLIDEDYQGEVIISAWNRSDPNLKKVIKNPITDKIFWMPDIVNMICIKRGDRIAQLMFTPIIRPEWKIVEEFSNMTDRNIAGFGSSGK